MSIKSKATNQHTPGPWEVKAVNGKHDEEPALYIVTRDGNDLMRGDFCRSEADANLIAAAPELLAALRNFVGFADYHEMVKGFPRLQMQLLEIRAAIAKAEVQS